MDIGKIQTSLRYDSNFMTPSIATDTEVLVRILVSVINLMFGSEAVTLLYYCYDDWRIRS